jgi:hypothetical protein
LRAFLTRVLASASGIAGLLSMSAGGADMATTAEASDWSRQLGRCGYRGEILELEAAPDSQPAVVSPLAQAASAADSVELTDMAARAMHYLTHNPVAAEGYRCRFGIDLLRWPVLPAQGDPVSLGDTESRMDLEFIYMREMSGLTTGREVEAAIRDRIRGYIREDGLCWVPPYCLCGPASERPVVLTWTTGYTVMSLVERAARDGASATENLALAARLVRGLQGLASWDTGRAYYPGGLGGWDQDGWLGTKAGCSDLYPCIMAPLARYIEVTGDPDALAFARAFADGMLADLQTSLGDNRIRADGSFGGYNCHLHLRAVAGVAHLGLITQHSAYLEWARRAYDWLMSAGADWGWFPEGPPPQGWNCTNSETCATGDMTDVAARLAQAGYSRYWDDVERFVRNYVREAQFFVTPDYEALYREVHKANPAQAEEGLRQARDVQGGFVARLLPNGLAIGNTMNMMGCCSPEGMRSLHVAWRNVVTESPTGVFVNLGLNRDAPAARVVSFAPRQGRLTVVAKRSADFFLRPPSWAPRSQVKAYRGSREVDAAWQGDYLAFAKAAAGEELTVTYPVPQFVQQAQVAGKTYSYRWLGSTVMGVEPRGEGLPIFTNAPRPLPAIAAPPAGG